MGLGKIARGAGKVGMLIEGMGYIVTAGRALVRVFKGRHLDREGADEADVDIPARRE